MSDWDKHRQENPLTCQFCGETDPTVDMWCGAPWGEAHRKCAEIAAEGITLYLKRELLFRGEDNPYSYSQQRGWFCENCKTFQYMSDGRACIHCGEETILAMTHHSSGETPT